ncbi:MAG: nucleotide exchange factor GrpE [bacterium]
MDEKDLEVSKEEQVETQDDIQPSLPVEEEISPDKEQVEIQAEKVSVEFETTLLEIKEILEKRIAGDETKEKMFNALYEQLKGYQGEFLDTFKKPIIKEIVTLYDDIINLEEVMTEESCSEKVRNGMGGLKVELLQILENMEVMPFDEHSDILDRRLQKAVRTINTTDPTEDKKIVEVVKEGFFWKEKSNILRPEEVVIKRYIGQQNQEKGGKDNV